MKKEESVITVARSPQVGDHFRGHKCVARLLRSGSFLDYHTTMVGNITKLYKADSVFVDPYLYQGDQQTNCASISSSQIFSFLLHNERLRFFTYQVRNQYTWTPKAPKKAGIGHQHLNTLTNLNGRSCCFSIESLLDKGLVAHSAAQSSIPH